MRHHARGCFFDSRMDLMAGTEQGLTAGLPCPIRRCGTYHEVQQKWLMVTSMLAWPCGKGQAILAANTALRARRNLLCRRDAASGVQWSLKLGRSRETRMDPLQGVHLCPGCRHLEQKTVTVAWVLMPGTVP